MNLKLTLGVLVAGLLMSTQAVHACNNSAKAGKEGGYMKMAAADTSGGEESMKKSDDAASTDPVDIIDTAVAAGSFSTLAKALTAAELIDTLKGEGPFTVFAPTDEAFAKIPEETLNAILADKDKLTKILTYHVVAGKVTAADVVKLDSAETVAGPKLTIDASDGVKVNDATVTQADVMASNGVIHVIDTVLLPPEE